MNEIEQGKKQFETDAHKHWVAEAKRLVDAGEAAWILDPYVKNVIGLVHASDGYVHPTESRAYVVVYLPGSDAGGKFGDFECADEFEELVYKSRNS